MKDPKVTMSGSVLMSINLPPYRIVSFLSHAKAALRGLRPGSQSAKV
jgi:hypothetical protein